VQCLNEQGDLLDSVTVSGPNLADTIWGTFIWGAALWGGPGTFIYQHPLNWHLPIISKQMSILATGNSVLGTILGNLNMQIENLGYLTDMSG
jgi:hypothetical protein